MSFYTQLMDTLSAMYLMSLMTFLTDKAAQVINQWGNCLKFIVAHRIYKNDRDGRLKTPVIS